MLQEPLSLTWLSFTYSSLVYHIVIEHVYVQVTVRGWWSGYIKKVREIYEHMTDEISKMPV